MNSVVYEPKRRHYCGPNDRGYWEEHWLATEQGKVRQCECGKTWVAYRDHSDPGYVGVKWRREGWLARRRRERRSASA